MDKKEFYKKDDGITALKKHIDDRFDKLEKKMTEEGSYQGKRFDYLNGRALGDIMTIR